jgi:hypothetical protein
VGSAADVERLVADAGLAVRPWPFAPPVLGVLWGRTVGVRSDLVGGALAATLAHELGHWRLGHAGGRLHAPWVRPDLEEADERDAQAFAGALLLGLPDARFDERCADAVADGVPVAVVFGYFAAYASRMTRRRR